MQIFFSGSRGTVKSHFVRVICYSISKKLLYHCKNLRKPRVLYLELIGISGINIGGTTIHFGLGIYSGSKLLSEVKF